MDTYFLIRRGKLKTAISLFAGLIFLTVGGFFLFTTSLITQNTAASFNLSVFIIAPIISLIIGGGLVIRAIHMIFNPTIITAGSRTIRYLKESYSVDRIHQLSYTSYYAGRGDNRHFVEHLNISGDDGALVMDITSKNMKTKDVLELFRNNYPSIPLVID